MTIPFKEWLNLAFESTIVLSRSGKGETKRAYRGKKKPLNITDPPLLRAKVHDNLRRAITNIWSAGDNVYLDHENDGKGVQTFIDGVAKKISTGLIDIDHELYRTWDTRGKYPWQVPPAKIMESYNKFCMVLAHRLNENDSDPLITAAWVERELNWHIHPFADGCGRTSRLIGAWVLLRYGLPPVIFRNVEEYYAKMREGEERWREYYRMHQPLLKAS